MDEIDAIALTHLHPDHTGDLEQFAVAVVYGLPGGIARRDIPGEKRYHKKTVYGPKGTAAYLKARLNAHSEAELVSDEVFSRAFGVVEWGFPKPGEPLETAPRHELKLPVGLTLKAVPVNHALGEQRVPAFGFRFEAEQEDGERPLVVAFSGDTLDHVNVDELARDADFSSVTSLVHQFT